MLNCNFNNNSCFDIINEFREVINFINYDIILTEKITNILKKYINFDALGIFFNSPDDFETNLLHLYINNNSIDINNIKDCFFKEISNYKTVINTNCEITYLNKKPEIIKKHIRNKIIIPFYFNNKLLGSIAIFSNQDVLKTDIQIFNFIVEELISLFKLKYMFTEQTFISSIDPLTKLYNRNQFEIGFSQEFNRCKRYNGTFSVAILDIDHFKNINDTMGHQFGDYVLQEVSQIIQNMLRKTDTVYRYGGEEIAILLPETNINNALCPLEKLRHIIEYSDFKNEHITVSIGVAEFDRDFSAKEDMFKTADNMLYKAKNSGRNRVCF